MMGKKEWLSGASKTKDSKNISNKLQILYKQTILVWFSSGFCETGNFWRLMRSVLVYTTFLHSSVLFYSRMGRGCQKLVGIFLDSFLLFLSEHGECFLVWSFYELLTLVFQMVKLSFLYVTVDLGHCCSSLQSKITLHQRRNMRRWCAGFRTSFQFQICSISLNRVNIGIWKADQYLKKFRLFLPSETMWNVCRRKAIWSLEISGVLKAWEMHLWILMQWAYVSCKIAGLGDCFFLFYNGWEKLLDSA